MDTVQKASLQTALPVFDNIILWRHAEAEQADFELGEDDNARQLTTKGQQQAKQMAKWLKQHLPKNTTLICSPAVRAVQTAEALQYKMQLHSDLLPGTSLTDVLSALMPYQRQNVLIVGHQPWLGELVHYLFEQKSTNITDIQSISIKKGAVWWLRHSFKEAVLQQPYYKLYTLQTPSLL